MFNCKYAILRFYIVWNGSQSTRGLLKTATTISYVSVQSNLWYNPYVWIQPCRFGATTKEEEGIFFSDSSFETMGVPTRSHTSSHTPVADSLVDTLNANDWRIKPNEHEGSVILQFHYLHWNCWKRRGMTISLNSFWTLNLMIVILIFMNATMNFW